jgi:hypothetical protein
MKEYKRQSIESQNRDPIETTERERRRGEREETEISGNLFFSNLNKGEREREDERRIIETEENPIATTERESDRYRTAAYV